MKHLFIILLMIFVLPSFANIDAENDSPTCDESVLNASNGTANLEINWEPNVIPLRWYSGNTLLEPENNDGTCTYDGVLNRPTNPTREGYNFAGWRVRPTMDFSTIPTNVNGKEIWSKSWFNNAQYCLYKKYPEDLQGKSCKSDTTFAKLQIYEWKARFEHGDLYGMAGCSTESKSTVGIEGNPTIDNSVGTYCWCKATGYKPNNSDTVYGPSNTLSWVFRVPNDSVERCKQACAFNCVDEASKHSTFRASLFGI